MRALAIAGLLALAVVACGASDGPASTTRLLVRITDGPGGPLLAGRVVLYDDAGERLRIGPLDGRYGQDQGYCEFAEGVVGTWDGIALMHGLGDIPVGTSTCGATPEVPFGRYRVRVLRGPEHEIFETMVALTPASGGIFVDAPLERVFETGALAADLHVHSEGSGDSDVPRRIRVITELAAGIQVIGATDHNTNGDYATEIAELGLGAQIASLPGNEITVKLLHFNVFPVPVDPRRSEGGSPSGEQLKQLSVRQLFDKVREWPDEPLIQVNHPRLGRGALFDTAGWNGAKWPPPFPVDFDLLEVLNGLTAFNVATDRRLDRGVDDFYTLFGHGVFVTAVGNSDTHHLNGTLAGVPRSYVLVDDPGTEPFDQDAFLAALRARRVVATTGPWLDVRVAGERAGGLATVSQGLVPIEIHLRQASHVHARRVRLWIGGQLRRTFDVPEGARSWDWVGAEVLTADSWVGVDAGGDDVLPSDVTGDYLAERDLEGMAPFALVNPILVDVDGNGFALPGLRPGPVVDIPPGF